MSQEIEAYAKEINVPCLLHFTQLLNLESILTEGLLSRDGIAGLANPPEINDELRLGNHTNTISLSIAHPNSQMFYKYRMEKGGDWCVIGIHPRVLWSQDCLFCKHNAADPRISGMPIGDLSGISAFRAMYDEISGYESRSDQCLKACDPTDVQAEVLVLDSIELSNFIGVVFPSRQAKKNYSELLHDMQSKIHFENKGYYSARSYKRKYQ